MRLAASPKVPSHCNAGAFRSTAEDPSPAQHALLSFSPHSGGSVIRLWNDDVLLRIDDALTVITAALAAPHPALRATFSPHGGEKE